MLIVGKDEPSERAEKETTVLIAAKNGVTEIAKNIQEYFPVAIQDKNPKNKKIIRLTMQNRQQLELGNGKRKKISCLFLLTMNVGKRV
jgi:hypothetical protein